MLLVACVTELKLACECCYVDAFSKTLYIEKMFNGISLAFQSMFLDHR